MTDYFKVSRFFLVISALAIVIVTPSTLFPFIVGKYAWFRLCVDLALIFSLLGWLFRPDPKIVEHARRIFKTPLFWAVAIFTVIFLLAGFFGIDPHFSFWSNFERGEGGLQMLHLFVFFALAAVLFREEKHWQNMMRWFLAGGFLMVLYGIAAGLKWKGFIGPAFSDPGVYRLQGTIGNGAYVAVLSAFMIFYALYLLLENHRHDLKSGRALFSFVVLALFIGAFFAAATRGAFVGLVGAVIVFLFYFAYKHKAWRKWALIIGILVIVFVSIMVGFKDSKFVQSIPGSRIFDLSFTTQTFGDRVKIWNMAWGGFLAKPVLGWGPENFIQVFDRYFTSDFFTPAGGFGAWFDRAHSIIFDYLAETGILGFLSFVSIFLVLFWKFFRSQKSDVPSVLNRKSLAVKGVILSLPILYLIQGLVLFDVLPTYMNLFFFLAFATYLFQSDENKNPRKSAVSA